MKSYTLQKIILIIVVSFSIIICLALASFFFVNEMISASSERTRTNLILFTSERVRSLSTELKALQIQGAKTNSSLATQSGSVRSTILNKIQFLDSLTVNHSNQQAITRQLKKEVEKQIDLLLKVKGEEFSDSTLVNSFSSSKVVNELLDEIQAAATLERKETLANVTDQFYKFVFTLGGLLALWFIVLTALTFAIRKSLKLQRKTEEKINQVSADNLDLYENAPCGYFTINEEGILTNANKTLLRLLGYEKSEIVDRIHFENLFAVRPLFFASEIFIQLNEHRVLNGLDLEAKRKDGSIVPVVIDAFAILNKNGKTLSSRYTLTDNTSRKQAEREILQSNKELDAFTYSVSHDLRAPLRSVNGYAQILKEDYQSKLDEEGNRVIDVIVKNGKRMGQLIDDLLDFSRTSKKEITKSHIIMDDYVNAIASDLMEIENERDVRWTVLPLTPSLVDVSMMRQVWVNLLSNALKYSRNNELTTIEVGSIEADFETIYYVKDNGVGFDMKYYSKLFGVFQRLHNAEDFDGTGVGLALVKRIIERHNGRIWAESKIGEGATFFFSIPKIAAEVMQSTYK
jgi:PAS domain S-box-containing protein